MVAASDDLCEVHAGRTLGLIALSFGHHNHPCPRSPARDVDGWGRTSPLGLCPGQPAFRQALVASLGLDVGTEGCERGQRFSLLEITQKVRQAAL